MKRQLHSLIRAIGLTICLATAPGIGAEEKPIPASPAGQPAAPKVQRRVFAGGVAGVEDLLKPQHSERFRAAGGGLYLHNSGWGALNLDQRREVLRVFSGCPVAIELGFGKGDAAEAWAQGFKTVYAALGIKPAFIAANAFDSNNRPVLADWKAYTEKLRTTGGLTAETLVLPTFEYANFAPNIPTLAQTKVSQMPEFQDLIRYAGGIVLDVPCGYAFGREPNYLDWVVDAIQWTRRAGLRTVHIASPHVSAEQFDEDTQRLAALAALNLLDTEAEPAFDRITAELARIFEVRIALISLVDRDRQFFKSQTGLPPALATARQTPRSVSVCGHVVAKNQLMVIEDLARDRRFANNPLLKEHGIRFYAGVPLLAPNGQPIGSLCLMDLKPRQITEREKRLLLEYASEVMEEIAKRTPQTPADTTTPTDASASLRILDGQTAETVFRSDPIA